MLPTPNMSQVMGRITGSFLICTCAQARDARCLQRAARAPSLVSRKSGQRLAADSTVQVTSCKKRVQAQVQSVLDDSWHTVSCAQARSLRRLAPVLHLSFQDFSSMLWQKLKSREKPRFVLRPGPDLQLYSRRKRSLSQPVALRDLCVTPAGTCWDMHHHASHAFRVHAASGSAALTGSSVAVPQEAFQREGRALGASGRFHSLLLAAGKAGRRRASWMRNGMCAMACTQISTERPIARRIPDGNTSKQPRSFSTSATFGAEDVSDPCSSARLLASFQELSSRSPLRTSKPFCWKVKRCFPWCIAQLFPAVADTLTWELWQVAAASRAQARHGQT